MKFNIMVGYAGQKLEFKNVEFDGKELELHESVREAVVDDFYSNFDLEITDAETGMEY
jgi:hypothetical protein